MKMVLFAAVLTFLTSFAAAGQTGCPEITVSGPAGLTLPGDAMVFQANIPELKGRVTYVWKVSGGQITEGQGTGIIKVRTTDEDEGSNITATVTVEGFSEKCPNSASEVVPVASRAGCSSPMDEYGRIPWLDEKARLDNLLIMLKHNPGAIAYISMRINADEAVSDAKKKALRMINHLKRRDKNFDVKSIRFAIEITVEWHSTSFRVLPEGIDPPPCGDACILFSGRDL